MAEARSGVFVSWHPATEMEEERMIKIQAGKQQLPFDSVSDLSMAGLEAGAGGRRWRPEARKQRSYQK